MPHNIIREILIPGNLSFIKKQAALRLPFKILKKRCAAHRNFKPTTVLADASRETGFIINAVANYSLFTFHYSLINVSLYPPPRRSES